MNTVEMRYNLCEGRNIVREREMQQTWKQRTAVREEEEEEEVDV